MNRIEFVTDVPRQHLCTSCGGCVGICPRDALTMVATLEGTLAPSVDESKCNLCGLCLRVCPGYEIDVPGFQKKLFGELPAQPGIGNFLHLYAGTAVDNTIRQISQSGGVVSALLIYLLESGKIKGAIVTRWSKDDPLRPETYIARTREAILDAVGSKYCPVPAAAMMKQLFREEGKFVFVGTSCQIHALRKAAEIRSELQEKILAYFGLYCLGVFNTHFFDFILGKKGIARGDVKYFESRSKQWRGWPGDMRIETHSGHIINIPLIDSKLTPRPYFTPWRCTICPDKLNELSDISFGDCRIGRIHNQDLQAFPLREAKLGQSDIICRTSIGHAILKEGVAADVIQVQTIKSSEVFRTAGVGEKKLALVNLKILSRLLRRAFPVYNVTYSSKPTLKRVVFSVLHVSSLINSLISFTFYRMMKYPILRQLLQQCPFQVLRIVTLLHQKTANYNIFRQVELIARYHSEEVTNK